MNGGELVQVQLRPTTQSRLPRRRGRTEVRRACPPGRAGPISDDGMLVFANQIILVQGPGGTLLVDMGSGNDKQRPDEPWMDHVGLATTLVNGRWVPTFPRARYLASQADRDYFSSLPVAARHRLLTIAFGP